MFTCRGCGIEQPDDQFSKRFSEGPFEAWNLRHCKRCIHLEFKARQANPRRHRKQLKMTADWKRRNKEQHAKHARDYRARNRDKTRAQNRLNYAVRKGRIQRQPCEVCGETERVQAHHHSYRPEDWYNVRWLCAVCHGIEHTPDDHGSPRPPEAVESHNPGASGDDVVRAHNEE